MTKITAIIKNNVGIHVRPSGVILEEMKGYTGQINIISNETTVVLNSVMSLLTLGLMKGDEIEISVDGPDEEKTCLQVKELMERIYDFPQR